MGLELPGELADVAAKAGVRWPQADETALTASASAWREAGTRVASLSGDADGTASRALTAVRGAAGTAAAQHWHTFVAPDSGHLTATATGCHAAAARLDHAAAQVGSAKVAIVRHLVDLARNTDAATEAASAGHPTALAGLHTAIQGTAANVAHVNSTLATSIRLDNAGQPPAQPLVNANPGATAGLTGGLTSTLTGPITGLTHGPGHGLINGPGHGATPALGQFAAPGVGQFAAQGLAPVAHSVDAGGPGPTGAGSPPDFGPTGAGPGGVVPVVPVVTGVAGLAGGPGGQHGGMLGLSGHEPTPPMGITMAQSTAGAVESVAPVGEAGFGGPSLAGPQAGIPVQQGIPDAGGPTGGGFSGGGPAGGGFAGGGFASGGGAAGGGAGGGVRQGGGPGFGAGGPPAGFAVAPPPGRGPRGWPSAGEPDGADNMGADNMGAVTGPVARATNADRGADVLGPVAGPRGAATSSARPGARSAAAPVQAAPVAAAVVEPAADPGRGPVRRESVALFLVYLFPIGHLPTATSRPARQLPPPPQETDYAAGLRFGPHDHPRSAEIDDAVALDAALAGTPPVPLGPGRPEDDPMVLAVAAGHDPLGGGNERDWDRRFLVRPASGAAGEVAAEFAWPPGENFPEGGCADGEPVALAEGAVLDRFGSPEGRVFAADGTPFARRSLPPDQVAAGYHRYRVLRELPVWRTLSAPWFGQPGGGERFRAVYPAADLVAFGYLADVTAEPPEAAKPAEPAEAPDQKATAEPNTQAGAADRTDQSDAPAHPAHEHEGRTDGR